MINGTGHCRTAVNTSTSSSRAGRHRPRPTLRSSTPTASSRCMVNNTPVTVDGVPIAMVSSIDASGNLVAHAARAQRRRVDGRRLATNRTHGDSAISSVPPGTTSRSARRRSRSPPTSSRSPTSTSRERRDDSRGTKRGNQHHVRDRRCDRGPARTRRRHHHPQPARLVRSRIPTFEGRHAHAVDDPRRQPRVRADRRRCGGRHAASASSRRRPACSGTTSTAPSRPVS